MSGLWRFINNAAKEVGTWPAWKVFDDCPSGLTVGEVSGAVEHSAQRMVLADGRTWVKRRRRWVSEV